MFVSDACMNNRSISVEAYICLSLTKILQRLLPKIECIAGTHTCTQCSKLAVLFLKCGHFCLSVWYVAEVGSGASEKESDWQQMIKSFEYFIIAYEHTHTIKLYLELNISLTQGEFDKLNSKYTVLVE